MKIEKEELNSIIPHRGKMLLLSRVNDYNLKDGSVCAEYDITENCLFYDPTLGGVPAWAAFEFLAQAISAYSGIRDKGKYLRPRFGFILSIPFIKIDIPVFKAGSTVEIHAKENDRVGLVYTFEGKVFLDGRKVLEGKIMVMEIDEKGVDDLNKGQS